MNALHPVDDVIYSLVASDNIDHQTFTIDNITGIVRSTAVFDYETVGNYSFKVSE